MQGKLKSLIVNDADLVSVVVGGKLNWINQTIVEKRVLQNVDSNKENNSKN